MNHAERIIASQPRCQRGADGEWMIFCPWHESGGGGHSPSLGVNINKKVFQCFGCGEKGRLAKLIAKLENISYREAAEMTGGGFTGRYREKDAVVQLPEEYEPLPARGFFAKQALDYLLGRHIPVDQIKRHSIGFCASGKYRARIIIPITYEGKLISFVARDWTDKQIKRVVNPPGSIAVKAMFGWDRARTVARSVVITEGWADMLAVERVLLRDRIFNETAAVALCGKEVSEEKLLMLMGFEKYIIMLDAAAGADALQLETRLRVYDRPARIVKVPAKDPAVTDERILMRLLR